MRSEGILSPPKSSINLKTCSCRATYLGKELVPRGAAKILYPRSLLTVPHLIPPAAPVHASAPNGGRSTESGPRTWASLSRSHMTLEATAVASVMNF